MTQPPDLDPTLDRRYPNRDNSNWVRAEFNKQKDSISDLSNKIEELTRALDKAIPDEKWAQHNEMHDMLVDWKVQREKDLKDQEEDRREKRRALISMKRDFFNKVAYGIATVIGGIFIYGLVAKFDGAVLNAVKNAPPVVGVTK